MAEAVLDSSQYPSELHETVQKYEDFIRSRLEPDLAKALETRDTLYTRMSEYLKLKTHIDTIRSQGLQELETKVDLGSNFYAKAFVPDTSFIYVSVGFGFHLQMTLDEADKFIDRKVKHMEELADKYTEEASQIRAKIKMVR
ncbi:hypothetical protein LPJ61_005546 [Coemansia biformis]|uniref:Prefoldin alpha-like protein n=1 Tax=Coemansia biformis TaxID=1286918 RepID=A0A9W8CWI2_9FUNG|nr:hypothetical protein LPJ61_005546 [Coemansia biformis]